MYVDWVSVGCMLTGSVWGVFQATGDLCVDPDHFVLSRVNGTVEEGQ